MSYAGSGIPTLGVAQSRLFHCPAPRLVGVAGRRLGKTTYAAVRAFRTAYMKDLAEVRYIAPTYKQAKEIFWKPLKRVVPREYWLKPPHETELYITLLNGSTIKLLGAEDPDSLRGPGLDDVIFDEFADIDPKTWSEVIEPALADREGKACFLGTPKGYNHFYDLYQLGLVQGQEEWRSFTFTTAQGGQVKKSIIEKARNTLDHRVFRQEYEASFETLQGRVYDNFVRQRWPLGNIDPKVGDKGGPIIVGLDFNINPMSSVLMSDEGGWPVVWDEVVLHTSNTVEWCQHMRQRFPDREILVCPDASGQYNKGTNAPMGQTDFTILRQYGMKIVSKNQNPIVMDRVNNAQSLLLSGGGLRRIRIHPRCKQLIKGLEGLTWEEGKNRPNKKLGLDHICDAFGYPLWQLYNVLYALLPHTSPEATPLVAPAGFGLPPAA